MNVTINVRNPSRFLFGYSETNNQNLIVWFDTNTIYVPDEGTYFIFAKMKSNGRVFLKAKFISCSDVSENKVVITSVERVKKSLNKVLIKSVERIKGNYLNDVTLQTLSTGQSNIQITLPQLSTPNPLNPQRILTTVSTGVDCYSNSVKLNKGDTFLATNNFVINIDLNVVPNDFFVYFGIKAILPSGNTNEAFVKGKLVLGSNELNKVYILIGETI